MFLYFIKLSRCNIHSARGGKQSLEDVIQMKPTWIDGKQGCQLLPPRQSQSQILKRPTKLRFLGRQTSASFSSGESLSLFARESDKVQQPVQAVAIVQSSSALARPLLASPCCNKITNNWKSSENVQPQSRGIQRCVVSVSSPNLSPCHGSKITSDPKPSG